ncbi:MAG TPA: hypothetical protein DCL15_08260, partial [Chloroflexi bacterium]|nr:hypothetical protein [Chloroflexota bacterium]
MYTAKLAPSGRAVTMSVDPEVNQTSNGRAEAAESEAVGAENVQNVAAANAIEADARAHPVDAARIRVMATELKEPNIWLMRSVAAVLGMEAVEAVYQRTLEIEAAGGMMTKEGDRRRTSGGVFFLL